jgi:hypothetical protein
MTATEEEPMSPTTTDDLLLDSLRRRMAAMHTLWYDAVDTMGPEHVNHFERDGVLPIAFSLFHYPNMQDVTFGFLTDQEPTWNPQWQARVQMAIDDHGKERTVDDMIHQRVGDYDAFKDYMGTVYRRTESWLEQVTREDLDRLVIPRPFPPNVANTFSARVAGDTGVTLLDAIECWWYQHGMRHMGEIELARGLVGLGGMTS